MSEAYFQFINLINNEVKSLGRKSDKEIIELHMLHKSGVSIKTLSSLILQRALEYVVKERKIKTTEEFVFLSYEDLTGGVNKLQPSAV